VYISIFRPGTDSISLLILLLFLWGEREPLQKA